MKNVILITGVAVVCLFVGYFAGTIKTMVDEKFVVVDGARYPNGKENFDDFLIKFISDSSYQIQRIKFPLKSQQWEMDEVDSSRIEKGHWKTVRLFFGDQYRPQIYDNFDGLLRDTDERLFVWEGIENGINIEYRFSRIDGLWYLVEFADFSD